MGYILLKLISVLPSHIGGCFLVGSGARCAISGLVFRNALFLSYLSVLTRIYEASLPLNAKEKCFYVASKTSALSMFLYVCIVLYRWLFVLYAELLCGFYPRFLFIVLIILENCSRIYELCSALDMCISYSGYAVWIIVYFVLALFSIFFNSSVSAIVLNVVSFWYTAGGTYGRERVEGILRDTYGSVVTTYAE